MVSKILSFICDSKKRFLYLSHLGLLNHMSDERYLREMYYHIFGKELDLENPETFNEKLQWLKLHDRRDIYATMVDKYEVKKYVAGIIGEEYIIPTLGLFGKFDEIDFDKMPRQFVIKCTHDSGGLVVVKDKMKMDLRKSRKKISKSLKRNYYYSGREWPYKNVKPQIIVEKYMEDRSAGELVDYKVMCFGGKARMLFTCTERFGDGLKVTFFDLGWNKLPFKRHYPSSGLDIPRPKNLEKMVALSEELARDIPFVRIDWYEINNRLYFGEYTFYPGSGFEEFTPEKWDKKIGDLIVLPNIKGESK